MVEQLKGSGAPPRSLRNPWRGNETAEDGPTESAVALEQLRKDSSYAKMRLKSAFTELIK